MADIGASSWNEADASNNSAPPAGAPEGQSPSSVNDVIRAIMGAIKRMFVRLGGTVTTAGTNTVTADFTVNGGAHYTGDRYLLKFGGTNTGAATFNPDSLGAKDIKTAAGDALVGGEMQQNAYGEMFYDGTDMRLVSLYYKVGTYTPTLTLGGGSVSYTTQVGSYIRIGNLVWFQATIVINVATTPSGTVHLLLPFAVRNVTGTGSPILAQTVGTGAGTYGTSGRTVINTSTALINNLTGSPAAEGDLGAALSDGDTVYASGCYQTIA